MASEDDVFWASIGGLRGSKGSVDDLASSLEVKLRSLRTERVRLLDGAGSTDGILNPVKQKLDGFDQVLKILETLAKTLKEKGEGLSELTQLLESMNSDAEDGAKAADGTGKK